jgi:senataxin
LKSQIVCCTLATAGLEKLEVAKDTFDYLIVDEACQCIEPSTLIPFELGPKRVILVGDQNQLPATTFSENATLTKFSRSLFERLL